MILDFFEVGSSTALITDSGLIFLNKDGERSAEYDFGGRVLSHYEAGDRAVLIGSDGNEKITADGLGEMLGTIGYEIVCGISTRVERIYK